VQLLLAAYGVGGGVQPRGKAEIPRVASGWARLPPPGAVGGAVLRLCHQPVHRLHEGQPRQRAVPPDGGRHRPVLKAPPRPLTLASGGGIQLPD